MRTLRLWTRFLRRHFSRERALKHQPDSIEMSDERRWMMTREWDDAA